MPKLTKEEKIEVLGLYEQGLKKCTVCKEIKPLGDFHRTYQGLTFIPYYPCCKDCCRIKDKQRYANMIKLYKERKERSEKNRNSKRSLLV